MFYDSWFIVTYTNDRLRGAFDISLIASIASHLSYWGDEDVSHFIMSQLLSRSHIKHRVQRGGR